MASRFRFSRLPDSGSSPLPRRYAGYRSPSLHMRRRSGSAEPDWRTLVRCLGPLLGLALVAQFALAMFEATFALHAQAVLNYGPAEVGAVFVVCGLVMAVFQVGASGLLAGRVGEMGQIGMGFALMGTSLAVLMMPRRMVSVLAAGRRARAGDGAHRSEPCGPDLDTRWEPPRRHRTRGPECGEQPRAGERSAGRRRALRLADERTVSCSAEECWWPSRW